MNNGRNALRYSLHLGYNELFAPGRFQQSDVEGNEGFQWNADACLKVQGACQLECVT